mmetsp:Transcript_6800/g.12283  ORF Transcript_6800/g.12283 Transcript_6800/m.12283 type:complete len:382 (-) Transcript_6800:171-1316(-)
MQSFGKSSSSTEPTHSLLISNLKAMTAEAYSSLASIRAISSVDKLREFYGVAQRSLEEDCDSSEQGLQTCFNLLQHSTQLFNKVIMDYSEILETATAQAQVYSKQLRVIYGKTAHCFSSLQGLYIEDSDSTSLKYCEDLSLREAMIEIAISCDNLEGLVSKASAQLRKEERRRCPPETQPQIVDDNYLYEQPQKSVVSSVYDSIMSITNVCFSKKAASPPKSQLPPPAKLFSTPKEAKHLKVGSESRPSPPSSDASLASLNSRLLRVLELCNLQIEEGTSPQEAFSINANRLFSLIERSYRLQCSEVTKVQDFLEVFSIDYDSISSGDWNCRTVHPGIMSLNLADLLQDIGVLDKVFELRRAHKKQVDDLQRQLKRSKSKG